MTTTLEAAVLRRDARNRALRTFLQGLVVDVAAAVVVLLLPLLTDATSWADLDWPLIGFLLAKTGVVTGLSYLMRTVLDRSRIPTPLPPAEPGEPDDDTPTTASTEDETR